MARSDNREKRIRHQSSNIDSDELHGWPPPSPPSLSPRPARLRTDIESLNLQRPLTSLQERLARQEAASDLPLSPPEPSHEVFDQDTFFDTTIPLTAPLNLSLSASSSPHETHSSSGSNSPSPPPSPTRRYFERPAIRRKQPSRFPSPPATASSASPSQRNGTDAGPSTTSTAGRKAMARRSLGSIPSPRIIMQTTRSEQIRQQESFEIESESDTTEAKSDKEEKRKMVAEEANKSRISAKTTSTQKDDTPVSATNQKRRRSNSSSRRPRRVSTPTRRSTRKTRTNRNANSSGSSAQQTGSNQSRNSARHPSNRRHRQTRATRTSSTQPLRRSERIMSRNAKKATSPS